MNCPLLERHCLALIFVSQKLIYYFLLHPLNLVTKSNPMKYLLSRPALLGRIGRWLLQLSESDIATIAPKWIQSQALLDLLTQLPSDEHEPLHQNPC